VVTADRDRWIQMMLRDEYGLPAAIRSPWRAAAATLSAFLVCGLVPLLPFALAVPQAAWVSAGATGGVFAVIGALKSQWSVASWWRSALETLAVGSAAAVVAYGIGAGLRDLAS
jgi:vacuolar iron transporter family protein